MLRSDWHDLAQRGHGDSSNLSTNRAGTSLAEAGGNLMSSRFLSFSLPSLALLSVAAACGGATSTEVTSSAANTEPDGGPCVTTCKSGETQVADSSHCLQDDATCYSRTACGTTFWCTGTTSQCDGHPECKNGFTKVKGCRQNTECVKETACGESIFCEREIQCAGVPSCMPGDFAISGGTCPTDVFCYSATECGVTILCIRPVPVDGGPKPPPPPPPDSGAPTPETPPDEGE